MRSKNGLRLVSSNSRYKMTAGKILLVAPNTRHLQLISDPTGFRPRGSPIMPSVGQS